MATRQALDQRLRELLLAHNVDPTNGHLYYQSPGLHGIIYPALIYSRELINMLEADNRNYAGFNIYQLTWVSRVPMDPMVDYLLDELENIRYIHEYTADGLYHTRFRLYY